MMKPIGSSPTGYASLEENLSCSFPSFLGWHWALTNFAIECWGEALHNIIYLPLTLTNKQSAAFNPKGNHIDRY
jgi:hypothetical protein